MRDIPQPKPNWLLRNIPDVDTHGVVQSLMALARQQGPIFRLELPYEEIVVVSSQKLVDEMCDETRFEKKIHRALHELRSFVGDSLFTARNDEPNWGIAHRILMPGFGIAALRIMFDGVLDIAQQMLLKWERQGEEHPIDVADNMTRLTLDSIALCGFSYRFNSFYQNEMHPFVHAMMRALAEALARMHRLPIQTKLMLLTRHQFSEDARMQHHFADQLIAERRKCGDQAGKKDLLSLMLSTRDSETGEYLSDGNIRYQIVNALVTGHETTSGLLSFALYYLLENKEALVAVRAEAERVFAGEVPRFEHVARLSYTEQVLKECLRLWPPAPVFAVHPLAEETTLGDYRVNRKQAVCALLPMLHRDVTVWGPDVEAFRPERFAADAFARFPPNSWKPFGNGQRACLGRPFAMM